MRDGSRRGGVLARSSVFAAALAGLSGCPQGADLENPERFTGGASGVVAASGTGGLALPIACDWQTGLTKSCAINGCHGKNDFYAGLVLVVDDGLFDRLKDVPGTLGDVDCDPSGAFVPCETPPLTCSSLVGLTLVDSQLPENSLMLKKLEASGCGNQMPMAPGNSTNVGWSNERLDCLQQMVRAIAALP